MLPLQRIARATPPSLARRVRGLSDRTIAWLFVGPTILLLLAINIFPLIWTIRLSFTNFRANRPNEEVEWVGLRNYQRILTDKDVWLNMQATAHFLFWTLLLQVVIGFTLAWLINKKFRGNDLWTTLIVLPMMLSPAVVGNFWKFLYQPQIGLFNYAVEFVTGTPASSFQMLGDVDLAPWSIVIVDTWMWTPFVMLICLAGCAPSPTTSTRRPRSTARRSGGSSGPSPSHGAAVPDACRCCSAASRTSRCSTSWSSSPAAGPGS
jgi:multiple sugar transport system permease protein